VIKICEFLLTKGGTFIRRIVCVGGKGSSRVLIWVGDGFDFFGRLIGKRSRIGKMGMRKLGGRVLLLL